MLREPDLRQSRLFLTGGTGFLGARLRTRLQNLDREISLVELNRAAGADLLQTDSYARELSGADTVVHLAAATGKVSPYEHFRVNAEGTRVLLEQCQRYGVQRFLFLSSIAVKFPDIRHYPYARAKIEAEAAVAGSRLDFTIIRPTIIVGRGSPVLDGLRKLAMLPVVPVFGTGQIHVQPILVDDLVDCLVSVIRERLASCETIEIGGPEVVTTRHLLSEMHRVLKGKPAHTLRVPLAPILPVLAVLESIAYRVVPVTVGQLSTFRFDGVASANPVLERHLPGMTGLSRMLELSFAS